MAVLRMPIGAEHPGAVVEFEVDDADPGVELLGRGEPDVAEAPRSLAGAMDGVLPALSTVMAKLRSLAPGPDEVTLQLGLKAGGETGLVFVKGTAEATLAVTVTWKRDRPAEPAPSTAAAAGVGNGDGGGDDA